MSYFLQKKRELLKRLGDVVNRTDYDPSNTDRDLFVSPDESIGTVVFVYSDCDANERSGNILLRAIFSILTGIVGVIIAGAILLFVPMPMPVAIAFALVMFAVGGYIGYASTEYSRFVCYVGEKGAQWNECRKSKSNIVVSELFLFSEATDLLTSLESSYVNDGYEGTNFSFTWSRRANSGTSGVYSCVGKFKELPGEFPPWSYAGARYLFGTIVEKLWTDYLTERLERHIASGGCAEFDHGNKIVRVSPDYIELVSARKTVRIRTEDIDLIMTNQADNAQTSLKVMEKALPEKSGQSEIVLYLNKLSNFEAFRRITEKHVRNIY